MPKKSFWKRPEGVTGGIFLVALLAGAAYVAVAFGGAIIGAMQNALTLGITITALAALVYMVIDPKMRALIGFGYKSFMRWITGWFVQVDPIGVLKSYVDDLRKNLRNMGKQIGSLRGQMRRLHTTMSDNKKQIEKSMKLAQKAKIQGNNSLLALELRKVGRLKESNQKLDVLYKKMEVMLRVLKKMYENSEILLEDIKDQVNIKEMERKAIHASHSAIQSAMNIISGDKDQRYLFDEAMEALAEDVAGKVGEMERFMDVSTTFMDSIDMKSGIMEDEGLKMLEEWEKKSDNLLLSKKDKEMLLDDGMTDFTLDLNEKPKAKIKNPIENKREDNRYSDLF